MITTVENRMILLEIPNTFAENNQKMSESTFQVKTRVNAVNVPISEMDAINAKIIVLSEKTGRSFATIKDLFTFMLDYSLDHQPAIPETELESQFKDLSIRHDNVIQQNISLVNERDSKDAEIQKLEGKLTDLINSVGEKNSEIDKLRGDLRDQPKPIAENDGLVVFEVTEDEATVLKGIAENRLKKGYEDELHDISAMAKKMIFNRPTLINMSGGFYTGV